MRRPKLMGIVNITSDSFSDGGKFLDAERAIAQAHKLIADGADVIELSGVSSNPRAAPVSVDEQIRRMEPVLSALVPILNLESKYRDGGRDVGISVDASDINVQRWAIANDVACLNDIRGFPEPALYPELARSSAKLVVMHMMGEGEKAGRAANTTEEVLASIERFFTERLAALERSGVARERLIVDPGMGFFLSSAPEPSFAVLERVGELKRRFGLPVMISASRKSFLRGGFAADSAEAAARTLDVELQAVKNGADYIRTHDVGQLRRALDAQK